MRRLSLSLLLTFAVGATGGADAARAQGDDRLARLDPPTREAVLRLADSLRREGLPAEPVMDKAREGATKGAPPARIESAARALAGALGTARDALGRGSSSAELEAGAAALRAGASRDDLGRLRKARPKEPLTVPLATLAGLVAEGVPADVAADRVAALVERKAKDADVAALQRGGEGNGRGAGVDAPVAAGAAKGRGRGVADPAGPAAAPPGRAKDGTGPKTRPPKGT